MNKKDLKEYCIQLFAEGKTITEIAKLTSYSRKYIANLLKEDEKYIQLKNTKKLKVYKRKNNGQMMVYIPTSFLEKLGISRNKNNAEYVNVFYDKKENKIIISKV
ncbi:MAG TPA: hypothetical protein DCE23_03985 [Firmicutes bacterium]|nr:hypothetical protein [Bacillota bacterium]